MKKIVKKGCVMILLLSLLAAVMGGSAFTVSARSPARYNFGTWTGSGAVSATIKFNNSVSSVELSYSGGEVDRSNYTVTGDKNIEITLKEEFLKTLANGEYSFFGKFSGEELVTFKENFGVGTNMEARLPSMAGFNLRLVKVTYGDETVDSSNYTLTEEAGQMVITFKKEYIESLSDNPSFCAYLADDNDYAYLLLTVDVPDTSSKTPKPPSSSLPSSSSAPHKKTTDIPETGDHGSMAPLLITMSLSVIGCAVSLITRKKKNNFAK